MKFIRYRLEAAIVSLFFIGFRILPLDVSSWIGSVIGRAAGPLFSAHKTARKNLHAAFPDLTPMQVNTLLNGMWANLGRVAAEFSSLPGKRLTSRNTIYGTEHLPKGDTSAIFVSGHLGNWELTYLTTFECGVPVTIIYRHINNPYIEKIVADIRSTHACRLIQKGAKGATQLIQSVKRGESIAMLMDQKMNSGIAIPFFGRNAMTPTAAADLALKYNIPIIPGRVIRTKGAHFETHIYPPLEYTKTDDPRADARGIMIQINQLLEGWIREHPEQWFWVHQRWPKNED